MTTQQQFLSDLGACREACLWIGKRTAEQAWAECDRSDWMLWLFVKMVGKPGWPTRRVLVSIACDCAETVSNLWPKDDTRLRKAIEAARAWVRGECSLDDVRKAAADAAAYAADAAAYAADAARKTHLKLCADIVRKHVPTLPGI